MEEKILFILKEANQKLRGFHLADTKLEEIAHHFLERKGGFSGNKEEVLEYFLFVLQKSVEKDPKGILAKKLVKPYRSLYEKIHDSFPFAMTEENYFLFNYVCLRVMIFSVAGQRMDFLVQKIYKKELLKRKEDNHFEDFLQKSNLDVCLRLLSYLQIFYPQYYRIIIEVHGTDLKECHPVFGQQNLYTEAMLFFQKKYAYTTMNPNFFRKYQASKKQILAVLNKMKEEKRQYYDILLKNYGLSFLDNYKEDTKELLEAENYFYEQLLFSTSLHIYQICLRYDTTKIWALLELYQKSNVLEYQILTQVHGKNFQEQNVIHDVFFYQKAIRQFYFDLKKTDVNLFTYINEKSSIVLAVLNQLKDKCYVRIIKKRFGEEGLQCNPLESVKEKELLEKALIVLKAEISFYFHLFQLFSKEELQQELQYLKHYAKERYDIFIKVHAEGLDEIHLLYGEQRKFYMETVGIIEKEINFTKNARKLHEILKMSREECLTVLDDVLHEKKEYYAILQKKFGFYFNEWHMISKEERVLLEEAKQYIDKKRNILFSSIVIDEKELEYLQAFKPSYYAILKLKEEKKELSDEAFFLYKEAIRFVKKDVLTTGRSLMELFSFSKEHLLQFKNVYPNYYEALQKKYGLDFSEFHFVEASENNLCQIALKEFKYFLKNDGMAQLDEEKMAKWLVYFEQFYPFYARVLQKKKDKEVLSFEEQTLLDEALDLISYSLNKGKYYPSLKKKYHNNWDYMSQRLCELQQNNKNEYRLLQKNFGLNFDEWYRVSPEEHVKVVCILKKINCPLAKKIVAIPLHDQALYFEFFAPEEGKMLDQYQKGVVFTLEEEARYEQHLLAMKREKGFFDAYHFFEECFSKSDKTFVEDLDILQDIHLEYYTILKIRFESSYLSKDHIENVKAAIIYFYELYHCFLKYLVPGFKKNYCAYLKTFYPNYYEECIHTSFAKKSSEYKMAISFIKKDGAGLKSSTLQGAVDVPLNDFKGVLDYPEFAILKKRFGLQYNEYHILSNLTELKFCNDVLKKLQNFLLKRFLTDFYSQESLDNTFSYYALFYPEFAFKIRGFAFDLQRANDLEYQRALYSFIKVLDFQRLATDFLDIPVSYVQEALKTLTKEDLCLLQKYFSGEDCNEENTSIVLNRLKIKCKKHVIEEKAFAWKLNEKKKETTHSKTLGAVLRLNFSKMPKQLDELLQYLSFKEQEELQKSFCYEYHQGIYYKIKNLLQMYCLIYFTASDFKKEMHDLMSWDDLNGEKQRRKAVFLDAISMEDFQKYEFYDEHILHILVGDCAYDLDIPFEEFLKNMLLIVKNYQRMTITEAKKKLLEYLNIHPEIYSLAFKKFYMVQNK